MSRGRPLFVALESGARAHNREAPNASDELAKGVQPKRTREDQAWQVERYAASLTTAPRALTLHAVASRRRRRFATDDACQRPARAVGRLR